MSRFLFGAAPADYVVTVGTGDAVVFASGSTLTAWNAETSGTQYTDLTSDSAGTSPVATWQVGDGTTGDVGQPITVYGPDEVTQMWVSADGGDRVLMTGSDVASALSARISGITSAYGQPSGLATLDGSGRVPTSQLPSGSGGATTLDGLTDVDATSPVDGELLTYDATSSDYVLSDPFAATTKGGDLTLGVQTAPVWKVISDHVPDASEPNTVEFWSTYSGTPKLVAWLNERGMVRAEQIAGGTGWENPLKAIVAYNGTGAAYAIDRRNADSSRTAIGGIDVNARIITTLQPWTAITVIDPGTTGRYVSSTQDQNGTAGQFTFSALGVRYDSDDVVRLRGVVTIPATFSATGGDIIFNLPAGFAPSVARQINVGAQSGKSFPCIVKTTGGVVVRSTPSVSGATTLYFDGITFVK